MTSAESAVWCLTYDLVFDYVVPVILWIAHQEVTMAAIASGSALLEGM